MFCVHCGKKIPDTARFCTFCGKPCKSAAESAPQQEAQPTPQPSARPAAVSRAGTRTQLLEPDMQPPALAAPAKKKTSKAGLIVVLCVVLLLALAAGGGLFYRMRNEARLSSKQAGSIRDQLVAEGMESVRRYYEKALPDADLIYNVDYEDDGDFSLEKTGANSFTLRQMATVTDRDEGYEYYPTIVAEITTDFLRRGFDYEMSTSCPVPEARPSDETEKGEKTSGNGTDTPAAPSHETSVPADVTEPESPYLYPSDTQYITREELMTYTQDEVALIRNEIYARHGYTFKNEKYRDYFMAQPWYAPDPGVNADTFTVNNMSEIEHANVTTITTYESEMGWR